MGNNLEVMDLFCGAGGFSEGFRQQGFRIVKGVDKWEPAIKTFNHNFCLNESPHDMADFEDIECINALPDTGVIIGSPPCVHFSNSNKAGAPREDKSEGIKLIKIFLRIIAVKKYQPNSKLKAWFMENVPNSRKYLKTKYRFCDLNLGDWAKHHGLQPTSAAVDLRNESTLNSADFGVPQIRKRIFWGEIIDTGKFPNLEKTHTDNPISVRRILKDFPSPLDNPKIAIDPNYRNLQIPHQNLSDHSYDTGIYQANWESAQWAKTNHPYMGKMAFPENKDKPSRTITASKLSSSREALVYESEFIREGDGQYRTPTIREIATLMSFPISYQFLAKSEDSKWRLIGNAVCPIVSSAIARSVLTSYGEPYPKQIYLEKKIKLEEVFNLNNSRKKIFDSPPKYKKGKRLRRHPFKDGNMTVTLSNYCLKENARSSKAVWQTSITYGTGAQYKVQELTDASRSLLETKITEEMENGKKFINRVQNGFTEKISRAKELQRMCENSIRTSNYKLHPVALVEEIKSLVNEYAVDGEIVNAGNIFEYKDKVPAKQIYALYAVSQISKIANQLEEEQS